MIVGVIETINLIMIIWYANTKTKKCVDKFPRTVYIIIRTKSGGLSFERHLWRI